jgi:hypothetical protein
MANPVRRASQKTLRGLRTVGQGIVRGATFFTLNARITRAEGKANSALKSARESLGRAQKYRGATAHNQFAQGFVNGETEHYTRKATAQLDAANSFQATAKNLRAKLAQKKRRRSAREPKS